MLAFSADAGAPQTTSPPSSHAYGRAMAPCLPRMRRNANHAKPPPVMQPWKEDSHLLSLQMLFSPDSFPGGGTPKRKYFCKILLPMGKFDKRAPLREGLGE
ncbi:hypothetical protein CDAR_436851 [Caerostris darwini]|uniref:Uncharacterized protein n=1 Tax=Caerostris darwini TaxID=1538125 RepID=A0AAV4TE69_9ARAC|nr:hypothetical protein CDAR_436851 [Caerostris darwini]